MFFIKDPEKTYFKIINFNILKKYVILSIR